MKLNKAFTVFTMAIFALVFSFSLVSAEERKGREERLEASSVKTRAGVEITTTAFNAKDDDQNDDGEGDDKDEVRNKLGSTTARVKGEDKDRDDKNATSSSSEKLKKNDDSDNDDGDNEGDRQEKRIKRTFKGLNDISKEVPGLGDEIREIARNEASSTEERVTAIHEIQRQSFLSRLIFGSDKKKLKSLNDELKSTQKNIDRLTLTKSKIASSTLQTKIDVQIKSLETARTGAESFIKDNESAFSVFGFFAKIFGGK